MKKILVTMLFCFISVACFSSQVVEYIIIQAIGPKNSSKKPVLITKDGYIGAIKRSDTSLISYLKKGKLTTAQVNAEMQFKYDRMSTDGYTFRRLAAFILSNQTSYITSEEAKHVGYSGYQIILNGKVYSLDHEKEKRYFEELSKIVRKKKSSRKILSY